MLGKETILERFEVRDGGGSGNLVNIWKGLKQPLTDILPQKVLLLFDCDKARANDRRGNLFQRTLPLQADNPIKKGIENLFGKSTLHRARQHNHAFFDIDRERTKEMGGEEKVIPEQWTIHQYQKTNLCDWLCGNGTQEDFQHFQVIFDLIEEVLDSTPPNFAVTDSEAAP